MGEKPREGLQRSGFQILALSGFLVTTKAAASPDSKNRREDCFAHQIVRLQKINKNQSQSGCVRRLKREGGTLSPEQQ